MRLAATLCCLALPALAEDLPFAGRWTFPDQSCAEGEDITAQTIYSENTFCDITGTEALTGMGVWMLTTECQHEGEIYPVTRAMLWDEVEGKLWEWFGAGSGGPLEMTRCDG